MDAADYAALMLPAQRRAPVDQPIPQVACVQMDGGRLQLFDRAALERSPDGTLWREMKVGCLWSMVSEVSLVDPCPRLPLSFVDPERMREIVREIKGYSGPEEIPDETADEDSQPRVDERRGRPQPLARSVVASLRSVGPFGQWLVSEAYRRGFAAALRKAFVGDGSESNWGVWHVTFPITRRSSISFTR